MIEHIEKALKDSLFHNKDAMHAQLVEATHYALFSGGKRLRPRLTLEVSNAYGIPIEHALQPACALEYIHTYSLIHDDLPSMDNDDIRRGKPTLHKVYPEGLAILTGDFLLTHAFYLLSHAPHLETTQKLSLIQLLSQAAGGHGMISGQVADILLDKKTLKLEEIYSIHKNKTAALIATSLCFGGIIGKASQEEKHLLYEAGMYLGLAFQLVDDLLDADLHTPKKCIEEDINALFTKGLSILTNIPRPTQKLATLARECIYRVQ